jgi:hypothetical protein
MRRNGRRSAGNAGRGQGSAEYRETTTSGLVKAGLALLGGAGLGAGLLYLLDPEKGQQRRRGILRGASNLGSSVAGTASNLASSAAEYAGSALGSLRHAGSHAGEYARDTGSYFSDKYNRAKAVFDDSLLVEDKWTHRMNMTLCSLGSMVLGATLMYLLDPAMGRSRRGAIGQYARSAGENVKSAGQTVGDYAKRAGETVRSGASKVTQSVRNLTGTGRSGESAQSNVTGSDLPAGTVGPPDTTTLSSNPYGSSVPQM